MGFIPEAYEVDLFLLIFDGQLEVGPVVSMFASVNAAAAA